MGLFTKKEAGLGKHGRYYVYCLHYPDEPWVFGRKAGTVFYIGKGTRDRVSAHEKETRALLAGLHFMAMKHKHKVILDIWEAGYEVVQEIVGRTDDEQTAYDEESKLINKYGLHCLTNATFGHRPRVRARR
jgi:hypothetical protein